MNHSLTHIFILAALCLAGVSCSVYTKPVKVDEYLYSIEYSKYDFDKLSKDVDFLFHSKKNLPSAACSAVRKDSLFGRNFDWFYDEMPEFIIYVPASEGRFASIGVAAPLVIMKDKNVGSIFSGPVYNLLPAVTVDGINERGVACCINVTPQGDSGYTDGTNPDKPLMYAGIAIRYILDNASSAADAVRLLSERNIYTTKAFGLADDYHYLIADSLDTYVVEFVDNKVVALKNENIITNYNLASGVTPHAMGTERYEILSKGIPSATTTESMFELMKSVWFTQMYVLGCDPDTRWSSELCSDLDKYGLVTGDIVNDPDKFYEPFLIERDAYNSRSRKEGHTWQSVHTSIYNLYTRTLTISSQESGRQHVFRLSELQKGGSL